MTQRIVFMGTPHFAAHVLEQLINHDFEVVLVVTQPDRPVGRKRVLTPTPVKEVALTHHLEVFQPENIKEDEAMERITSLEPDLIITAAYGQFLPQAMLQLPTLGAINVHASLLPKYRGGAPIHYALWNGDEETGITIMYMTKAMDAGDIISQRSIPIESSDDVGVLFEKLAILGGELLVDTLPDLFAGKVQPQVQNEAEVSYAPEITKEQERINWHQTAQQIDNQIRAFRPFPSSYTMLNGERIKIWAGQPVTSSYQKAIPGQIVAADGGRLIIQCGQQTYFAIDELQPSGKKRMLTEQWLNGVELDQLLAEAFESSEGNYEN